MSMLGEERCSWRMHVDDLHAGFFTADLFLDPERERN